MLILMESTWTLLTPLNIMSKQSAGILPYRRKENHLEVFIIHPGGPFWRNKDLEAWSVPKGEFNDDEEPLEAAKREFEEELGFAPKGEFLELVSVKLKSGKVIYAWACEMDFDEKSIVSNLFEMEWPPRSGRKQSFPEVDRGGWFPIDEAKQKLNPAQVKFAEELERKV